MLHAGYGRVRFTSPVQPVCGTCTDHLMPARHRICSVVNSVGLLQRVCVFCIGCDLEDSAASSREMLGSESKPA